MNAPDNDWARRQAMETIDLPTSELASRERERVVSSSVEARTEPALGDVIAGGYELKSVLGAGGMGIVYTAINLRTGKEVALKMLRPQPGASARTRIDRLTRFQREASAAARIRHPNVVDIYDIGGSSEAPYLIMERLHGDTLRQHLKGTPLSPAQALALLIPAVRGVAEAHRRGVIHRDLKPENIFLARLVDSTDVVPVVLDFGVCRLLETDYEHHTLTRHGTLLGTPSYMPLEQLRGARNIDARADVFALGVVLYEALTGRLPFVADNDRDLSIKLATDEPTPLRELVPTLDERLESVVLRALAREPKHRYANAGRLLHALETWPDQRQIGALRHRPALLACGVLSVALLAALVLYTRRSDRLAERTEAESTRGAPARLPESNSALGHARSDAPEVSVIADASQGMHVSSPKASAAVEHDGLADEVSPGAAPLAKRVTQERHAELVRMLSAARGQSLRPGPASAGTQPPGSSDLPVSAFPSVPTRELSKSYIQSRMQEIKPLIQECYERELPEFRRPAGDIKLRFTIEGEPGVGGIVGESEVIGGSLSRHKEFTTCLTETMYTLEFVPPPTGGYVTVDYPIAFSMD